MEGLHSKIVQEWKEPRMVRGHRLCTDVLIDYFSSHKTIMNSITKYEKWRGKAYTRSNLTFPCDGWCDVKMKMSRSFVYHLSWMRNIYLLLNWLIYSSIWAAKTKVLHRIIFQLVDKIQKRNSRITKGTWFFVKMAPVKQFEVISTGRIHLLKMRGRYSWWEDEPVSDHEKKDKKNKLQLIFELPAFYSMDSHVDCNLPAANCFVLYLAVNYL